MTASRITPLALLLAVSSCATARGASPEAPPRPPYEVSAPDRLRVREDLVPLLRTAHAERSEVQSVLQGFGRVAFAPDASRSIRPAFPAFVDRVVVRVGDEVRAGATLAILRSADVARMRAEVRSAQRTTDAQRDALARLESLHAQGAASMAEVVEARARLESTRASIRGVQAALAAARASDGSGDALVLRASSSGRVLTRTIEAGERVAPEDDEPAFVIGDPSSVLVRAAFPEGDAPLLRDGARCSFTVPALGSERFDGVLGQVVGAVDRATHTAAASCIPTRADSRLRAEMVVHVEIDATGSASVVVPRAAVLMRRDDRVVFVQHGVGELERRVVQVGTEFGGRVRVIDGLREGEEVVVENAVLLDGELDLVL